MADQITLLVPYGKRPLRVELPLEVARWLRDQLAAALEERQPRKRRPVRLRRGRWMNRSEDR
jgi:hypothetical protein